MTHIMRHVNPCKNTTPDNNVTSWHCPICGRRIILQRNPFTIIELVPGDATTKHVGGMGGIMANDIIRHDPLGSVFDIWRDK